MVHRIAFRARGPQDILCDLEEKRYGGRIARQEIVSPIFVTGLPRAGTTLILETLARHPQLAAHRYRDMPFVLSPIVWRELSGKFRVAQTKRERAHKDGLEVNVDSAEAFEEVLWLRHFPDHYRDAGIELWSDLPAGFVDVFVRHMQSLIVSRSGEDGHRLRYLSKNNANIARLPALKRAFPDAHFVVPVRDPLDQARSLLRQHQLALRSHAESRFSRDYVEDIGHFEFGEIHRPILFEGMAEVALRHVPDELAYWLEYWIAAHRHLAGIEGIEVIDMERFTRDRPIAGLLGSLGLDPVPECLDEAERQIRPIRKYADDSAINSERIECAAAIYQSMRDREYSLA